MLARVNDSDPKPPASSDPTTPAATGPKPRASLPLATVRHEKLGLGTIMDRELAAQHGVPYVHLAAFAIDTDRVRERFEEVLVDEDQLPFGWEIFLTAQFLHLAFEHAHEGHRMLVEDAVQAVLDRPATDAAPLGAQLPFAVYDLVRRGLWPEEALSLFDQWRKKPDASLDDLEPLWADALVAAGELAHACLQCDLEPPAAPPVQEAWGRFVLAARGAGVGDDDGATDATSDEGDGEEDDDDDDDGEGDEGEGDADPA